MVKVHEPFPVFHLMLGALLVAWMTVAVFFGCYWVAMTLAGPAPVPQVISPALRYDARHACDLRDEADQLPLNWKLRVASALLAEYRALTVFRREQEQYERHHPGETAPTLSDAGAGVC